MTVTVTTHLNFDGAAHDALSFYAEALGGELTAATYGQVGAAQDPAWADRVVFGQVTTPAGFRVMAFDVWPNQPYDQGTNAFYVFLTSDDADEVTAAFHGLSEGAQEVFDDLGPSAWSPLYARLRDRFGVVWAISLDQPQDATSSH
jgi:PhnB protein